MWRGPASLSARLRAGQLGALCTGSVDELAVTAGRGFRTIAEVR